MRYIVRENEFPGSVPCRVIGKLRPGTWRIIFGDCVEQLDYGFDTDWPEAELPEAARRPNGVFWAAPEKANDDTQGG